MTTRIMVLIDTLATGGAENVAVDLACGLDRRRFAPHVVVTRSTGPLQQRLDRAGIPVTVLNRTHRLAPRAYLTARRIAKSSDVIHAHKFTSNAWAALLARDTGTPLVAHEHNWSGTPSRLRATLNRRWIGPVASTILCVSTPVQDQLSSSVSAADLRVLPNAAPLGVALSQAKARAALDVSPDAFAVGIVARLSPEKNHELLLRAMARLNTDGLELTLCVIGDGPRRTRLHALACELNLPNIRWMGDVREAGSLVSAFDVAVLCSDWEGLPLAVLEAMAAGVPTVATAVGALPELMSDGAGVLVAPGDVSALADAIRTLHDEPTTAALIGAAGRRRVRDHYDPALINSTLEAIYESVAGTASKVGTS